MTRRNVQTLPPAVDIVGCCLPVRDICVIMREVFREGIQFVIVFSFNISHYILCLLTCLMLPFELIWCCNSLWLLRATSLVIFWSEEFFMCLSRFEDLGISFSVSQLFKVFVSVFIWKYSIQQLRYATIVSFTCLSFILHITFWFSVFGLLLGGTEHYC